MKTALPVTGVPDDWPLLFQIWGLMVLLIYYKHCHNIFLFYKMKCGLKPHTGLYSNLLALI